MSDSREKVGLVFFVFASICRLTWQQNGKSESIGASAFAKISSHQLQRSATLQSEVFIGPKGGSPSFPNRIC